ncbi:keratin-associated protein 13-1-like [Suncus etruscus]|uniref:keratin-associated protein 13-1-like n=1 Tax=Suncus etruscus TaxID=109475 RepID=UPI00210FB1D0|nr:keratin-associated protein 13-1-like [Suncus etruscus]
MSSNYCSGNFSTSSLGGCRHCPSLSSCYPSNLVNRNDICSPRTCQVASSINKGCQETICEPTKCQTSFVVSRPCQTSCFQPWSSILWRPQETCSGSLGCRSSGNCSLGYGSRSCYSLGCGSQGLRSRSYGVCGFPSLSYGNRFCYSYYCPSRRFYTSYYQPFCTFGFY